MNWIKEVREKAGMSQEALAGYLCISKSLVYHAEKNLRNLPLQALLKMADLQKKVQVPLSVKTANNLGYIIQSGIQEAVTEAKKEKARLLTSLEKLNHKQKKALSGLQKNASALSYLGVMAKYTAPTRSEKEEHWLLLHTLNTTTGFTDKKLAAQALLHLEGEAIKARLVVYENFISKYEEAEGSFTIRDISFLSTINEDKK